MYRESSTYERGWEFTMRRKPISSQVGFVYMYVYIYGKIQVTVYTQHNVKGFLTYRAMRHASKLPP